VSLLRRRKQRENDKPFAVMVRDEETLFEVCYTDDVGLALLRSPAHPIVLLPWRSSRLVASDVAPKNKYLGVMLPYTPLHRLLLDAAPPALVMTSGNVASEPLVKDNDEAKRALADLADGFLAHDRVILNRLDDTVMKVVEGKPLMIRRARGYVPLPVTLKAETASPILAVGAHLKNTFAVSRGNLAFLGPHIGDMENIETLSFFEEALARFKGLFRIEPAVIAHDLHPGYVSTKWAIEQTDRNRSLKLVAVQHHAAHVAAVMAEYGLTSPVIGVSFDGLGYGDDGSIWGGEFLVGDLRGFARVAHLEYVPMPGGDLASMQPWRMAIAFLWKAVDQRIFHVPLPFLKHVTPRVLGGVVDMIQANINSPFTSSAGRLFDAVSALAGMCREHSYDAQAAIELEMCADAREAHAYSFPIVNRRPLVVKTTHAIRQVVDDILAGRPPSVISAKLHRGLASAIVEVARRMSAKHKTRTVVLGGGVFQNGLLCALTLEGLREAGLAPYLGSWVPPNDGGVALGQLSLAAEIIRANR
jgi:hydrogenase maturation protein HypF